ncbi:MAG: DUF362 domain-containing protein [Opitutaceae bacterium]|jgi:uncharacterized protein (DUF362 family)
MIKIENPTPSKRAGLCALIPTLSAAAVLVVALAAGIHLSAPAVHAQNPAPVSNQPHFVPSEPANSPMGVAFGIKPGRVSWAFDPNATSWDGTSVAPGWWDDSFTHPAVVEKMLADVILSVGDAKTVQESWNKIFTDFNRRHGRGDVGYTKGEKIVVKLNLNQVHDHGNGVKASYIAPQLVEALLRQLVEQAGASPSDVTFYDAIRDVPSTIFDRCTKAFPGVHFVDSTGTDGREKAVVDLTKPLVLSNGSETLYFPTCVTQAQYMINFAGLKGHYMAGMTVCAKNHQGTILKADGSTGARDMHQFLAVEGSTGRRGGPQKIQAMGDYNALVDMNAHPQTGGKTVLYLIDGLYATKHNEYRLDASCKWQSAPFNNNWTSSVFASQDEVAIDSVALDFLRNEPTISQIVAGPAVDNYLHELALANNPPSKIVYDPDKSGKPLASQGVHEHWNNAADRQYSRNLGTGPGIELVSLNPAAGTAVAVSSP